ncbi:MAG: hypothetical protein HYS05_04535 [Acidobacteria bacterium]|nr:hypothetical protein [Acidobacteriota bacterium]
MSLRQVVARAFVLLLAAATFASGQTLADVAKKEEERRKAVKQPSKVITNEDLKPVRTPDRPATAPAAAPTESAKPAQPGTAPPADASAKPPAPGAATPAKPAGEASPGEKKDETYWRNRITTVRTALQRNLVYVDAMQSRINALTTDFVNRDDPAQRAVIAADRQKALAELDRLKKEIEAQTKEIAQIEEEARRAGVPPGWLR